jgi:hypothetical protein
LVVRPGNLKTPYPASARGFSTLGVSTSRLRSKTWCAFVALLIVHAGPRQLHHLSRRYASPRAPDWRAANGSYLPSRCGVIAIDCSCSMCVYSHMCTTKHIYACAVAVLMLILCCADCTDTYVCAYIHIYVHTYISTCIHACICMYKHTCTCMRSDSVNVQPVLC